MQREKPVDKPKPEARTFPTLPKIKRTSSKPVAEVKPTVKKRTSIVPKVEQLHHKIFISLGICLSKHRYQIVEGSNILCPKW